MEGVGDEVLIFGAATVATAVMLYYAVINFFLSLANGHACISQVQSTDWIANNWMNSTNTAWIRHGWTVQRSPIELRIENQKSFKFFHIIDFFC